MRHIILTYFFLLINCCYVFAQQDNLWIAFWDDNSELMGFKDQNGKVKIEPKFMGFTMARKFDKIIAVMEDSNGTYKSYYLTKAGKTIGYNSLHILDNSADCESEGFIRFSDEKTGKVGMFNGNGEIAIPAEYDALSRVRNGLIIALKDAKKKFWDGNKHSGCNHFSWVGGKEYLIDTSNQVIVKNFKSEGPLNFFSLKTEPRADSDSSIQSFRGVNGLYYSFIDYKKEFGEWLESALFDSFTKESLLENSYNEIYFYKEPTGWINEGKNAFFEKNFDLVKSRLLELKRENADYFISIGGLNPYIFEAPEFDPFFNHCGEAKYWEYPVMNIVISHTTKTDFFQDQFEFLRTENGYQLISVSIGNEKIK